jgi:transposase
MGYSNDLRVRVIQVVEGGAAARAAARQFVIGDSTAIRWAKRWRETGSFEAKSNKGQSRSPLKKHEEWLLGLVRQEPDLTLEEIQRRLLDERQQKAGIGSIWRFFDRHGISFKKKAFGRPSKIGLTSPRRGRHGRTINPSSMPTDWSSSTKPAPQPKWRGCVAGLHAASGWSAKSRTVIGKLPPLLRACAPRLLPRHVSLTAR